MPSLADVGDAVDRADLTGAGQRLGELGHDHLAALAAGDVVRVLERLVRHEGHVRAADDDGDASPAQLVGDAVRLGDRRGGAGDADEVGAEHVRPVDRRQLRVEDAHIVARLNERGADHGQSKPDEVRLRPEMTARRDGLYQADLHGGGVLVRGGSVRVLVESSTFCGKRATS